MSTMEASTDVSKGIQNESVEAILDDRRSWRLLHDGIITLRGGGDGS